METSVDPNASLSPSIRTFRLFPALVYLRRARARVSRSRKCVSRMCVRAQCQGSGRNGGGGRGCLQCRFQDYPRISMVVEPPSTNQDSRSTYSPLFGAFKVTLYFLSFTFSFYFFVSHVLDLDRRISQRSRSTS